MANENIIKAVQRVADKDGNLVPIFPVTSSDAVYYDIDKQITIKDKIDGGEVTPSTFSYNNIFEHSSDGDTQTGILKIDLPYIKDNDVEIDLSVSTATFNNTYDMTQLNVPSSTTYTAYGESIIHEMSPSGSYIFTVTKRGDVYEPNLYFVSGANIRKLAIGLDTMTTYIRARFTKDSRKLIIYGSGDTTSMIVIYSLNPSGSGVTSGFVTYNPVNTNSGTVNIEYFDTCVLAGKNYLLTNSTDTTKTFECFEITDTGSLVASTAIISNQAYTIDNEMRISNNSMKVAILSTDSSMIHCMGTIYGSGLYQFRSVTDMATYAWGSAYSSIALGKWSDFEFNYDGSRLYGTYEIGYSKTFRVCYTDASNGNFEPNHTTIREVTIHTDATPFDIGAVVYKPIPSAAIYGASGTVFNYLSAGTISGSTNTNDISGPIIRCSASTTPTLSEISYTTSSGIAVTETAYIVPEANLTWKTSEPTLASTVSFKTVLIHPTSGYAYAVLDIVAGYDIVPYYIGGGVIEEALATSPSYTPIPSFIRHASVSYDGSAVGYIDNSNVPHLCSRVDGRYVHHDISVAHLGLNPAAIGCNVMNDGETIIVTYTTTIHVYMKTDTGYRQGVIVGKPTDLFTSSRTDSRVFMSPYRRVSTYPSDFYYWNILKTEPTDTSVGITVCAISYSYSTGASMSKIPVVDASITHTRIYNAVFNKAGDRFVLVAMDSDNVVRAYMFKNTGSQFEALGVTALTDGYYNQTSNFPVGTSALIPQTSDTDLFVYANSSRIINALTLNWTTNTAAASILEGAPTTNIYPVKMQYLEDTNRLHIATSRNALYSYECGLNRLSLDYIYDGDDASAASFSNMYVNEEGTVGVFPRELSSTAILMNIDYVIASGNIKLSGRYTDNGWTNVSISSDNAMLEKYTFFAFDSDSEAIIVGANDTIWTNLHVKINNITIVGENAGKYSYRLGYGVEIIDSLTDITNITGPTTIETEYSTVERINIKGYILRTENWTPYAVGGYRIYRITNPNITINSTVNVSVNDLESWMIANDAGLLGISTEHDGYAEIYAGSIPSSDITVDIDIFK